MALCSDLNQSVVPVPMHVLIRLPTARLVLLPHKQGLVLHCTHFHLCPDFEHSFQSCKVSGVSQCASPVSPSKELLSPCIIISNSKREQCCCCKITEGYHDAFHIPHFPHQDSQYP